MIPGTEFSTRRLAPLPSDIRELCDWPELEDVTGVALHTLRPEERRWVTIAATHRSALYERSREFPGVGAASLTLLESVGKAVTDVEVRRAVTRAAPGFGIGRRDQEVNRVMPGVRDLLVERLAIPRNARLGRGEATQLAGKERAGLSARTHQAVTYQVVGWWSLVLHGHRLRDLVDELHELAASRTSAAASAAEARTAFDQHVKGAVYDVVHTGPDHSAVFRATVRTSDGRTGTGEAKSKKAAQQWASLDYLTRHLPHALASKGPTVHSGPPTRRRPIEPAIDQRVIALAALFGCRRSEPFLQALTHRSWVYENTARRDVEHDSNAPLANLGSSVLSATTMRWRALNLLSRTSDPDPEVAVPLNIPDVELRRVFDALKLVHLARLGAGERARSLPDDMTSNIVQAVLAASQLQWPSHVAFEQHLPEDVRSILDELTAASLIDPFTRLQELAADLDFSIVVGDARRSGPDHQTTYTVAVRLAGLQTPILAEASERSKSAARKAAAATIIDSAALLSGAISELSDPTAAAPLLRRHLEMLPTRRSRWGRWHRAGRLGVTLLLSDDRAGFDRWSTTVLRALGNGWRPGADTEQALAQYYSAARRGSGARAKFTTVLANVTDRVLEAATGDGTPDALPLDDLVALSAAQGIWMSAGAEVGLAGVLADWSTLNRARCEIRADIESADVPISARAGAAVFTCLRECVTIARSPGRQALVVRGRPAGRRYDVSVWCEGQMLGPLAAGTLLQLATESATDLRVFDDGDSIRLAVETSSRTTGASWLTEAAGRASEADDYDAELARLVHELKNEITAVRVAARRPTATRTDHREAQLASSRHLDIAGGLAAQLRAVDQLYAAADLVGETELGSFLQSYVSDLIRAVDARIRVVPPAFHPVTVALHAQALRAVLDNLVANATAAIAAGGQINLDYVTSPEDGIVLVELADTGPGIPADVMDALAAGMPPRTDKRRGSGLGLLGVRRLLERAGGRLDPAVRSTGTCWLITLPTTDMTAGTGTGL